MTVYCAEIMYYTNVDNAVESVFKRPNFKISHFSILLVRLARTIASRAFGTETSLLKYKVFLTGRELNPIIDLHLNFRPFTLRTCTLCKRCYRFEFI